jgi:hypothetical protein
MPFVQAQVAMAVLAREQDKRSHPRPRVPLSLDQQAGAQALALTVGGDRQAGDLGGARVGRVVPEPHGRDQPAAVADAEHSRCIRPQLGPHLGERLEQGRQAGGVVRLRLGYVRRPLQGEQLPGVVGAKDGDGQRG